MGQNHRTKKRFQRLHQACEEINKRNLLGTGVLIYPGESGAWLEIEMDPRLTMITGSIRHDLLSYSKRQSRVQRLKKRKYNLPPDSDLNKSRITEMTTIIANKGKNINEIRKKPPKPFKTALNPV